MWGNGRKNGGINNLSVMKVESRKSKCGMKA